MLRRKFIKTSLIAAGGTLFLADIPLAGQTVNKKLSNSERPKIKPRLNLSGHKRSGCASRPELAAAFEDGYLNVPF